MGSLQTTLVWQPNSKTYLIFKIGLSSWVAYDDIVSERHTYVGYIKTLCECYGFLF